jgi:hypothetical protein
MWVSSTDPQIKQVYYVPPPEQSRNIGYCSYMYAYTWKFGWTNIPGIIHKNHCSSWHYSPKMLRPPYSNRHNSLYIPTSISSCYLSFFPTKVKIVGLLLDAKYRRRAQPCAWIMLCQDIENKERKGKEVWEVRWRGRPPYSLNHKQRGCSSAVSSLATTLAEVWSGGSTGKICHGVWSRPYNWYIPEWVS